MSEPSGASSAERALQRYRLALVITTALVIGLGVTVWQLTAELIEAESSRRAIEDELAAQRAQRPAAAAGASASAGSGALIAEPKRRQRLGVVDLSQRFAALAAANPENADVSETYLANAAGSVHIHVLGKGQTTPLHVHEREWEVTAIVSGRPVVRHRHGASSGITGSEQTLHPGAVVVSPPRCAHEWHNPDRDGMQANLVFASPPFRGNLYVEGNDPRLKDAPAPTIIVPGAALAAALQHAGAAAPRALGADMTQYVVTSSLELPASAEPSAAYVAEGAGTASAAGATVPFAGNQLLMVPAGIALTIAATRPSLLFRFAPE